MPQRLRIFISSPGDVEKERLRAGLIIDKLAQNYNRFFDVESYLWEHEPLLSSAHFQDAIEPPSAFDIVILILWSRIGTPLPEQTPVRRYRGMDGRAPVTGTEWEYEDALESARTRGAPDLMVFRNFSNAPIDIRNPAARDASIAQLAALDTFWKLHFLDQGSFRYAFEEYENIETFATRLEEALRKLLERKIAAASKDLQDSGPKLWTGDPFRGLDSYDFEQAPVFFGRDAQLTKAIEQLVANAAEGAAFLLVSGASGSGKSSLVKAAVVPRLMKPQRVTGAAFLRRAVFRAGECGADPFLALALSLTRDGPPDTGLPELIETGQDAAALAAVLRKSPESAVYLFGHALGRLTQQARSAGRILSYESAKLILVIDQFEELFSVEGATKDVRTAFVALIDALARSGHVWAIATMRSDFWHRAAEIPALLALAAGEGRLDIAVPTPAEQMEIIRKPVIAAGLRFEPHPKNQIGLDAVIAQDAADAAGVLPLLSFVLDELYQDARRRDSLTLTYSSYEALGGLEGAIAKRAEETVAAASPGAQAALPTVLRRLVTVATLGDLTPVSRSAPLEDFQPGWPARDMVDSLIKARLLVAEQRSGIPTVRLAHEALIERWRRARDQLASERRDLETKRILEDQFNRWTTAKDHRAKLLLRNPDLASAIDLAQRWGDELSLDERDYVRRSKRRARLAQSLMGAAALMFAAVALAAIVEGLRAQSAQRDAEVDYRLALNQAAGSADILNQGFIEGAINSRLMRRLAQRGQEAVSRLPAKSPDVSAARATLLIAMSPTMTAIGDTKHARSYAESALKIVQDLLARDPTRFDWRRLRAEAHAALAIAMFWGGEVASVRRENAAAIQEFTELAHSAPNDVGVLKGLMPVYENQGDTQRAAGDFTSAAATYTSWLNLANKLADQTNDRAQSDFWRSYAADAHLRLGDISIQQKDYSEAASQYRIGIQIASKLHSDDPGNAKFLEHLSLGYGKLGDALIDSEHDNKALEEISKNIELSDDLVNDLSANIRWLLYQEWGHLRRGHALLELKKYGDAYAEFNLYLKGVMKMRARDPGYVSALYDESNAHQWMGDAWRLQGDLEKAERQYQMSLRAAVEGEKRAPRGNPAARKILAMAYYRLGLVAEAEGQTQEAAADYGRCLAVKFNPATWTPRSTWPENVTLSCKARLVRLGSR